jgi:hypothetical protein
MEIQYFCQNTKRLQAVQKHATLNAIHYLEILDQMAPAESLRQRIIIVHCVKPISGLKERNVRIEGGVRCKVNVTKASIASDMTDSLNTLTLEERSRLLDDDSPDRVLIVEVDDTGDYSAYQLILCQSVTSDEPPPDFDPLLSRIDFSFKVECPNDFDCQSKMVCPPEKIPEPQIDYLAKDYASFRRLLLDRLSTVMPDWQERKVPDIGVALVEILSYVGDHLSYYQDVVANEAYLGTARKRISVRRHARLIDYPMHEGCNSRVWIYMEPESSDVFLKRGTQLLTRLPDPVTHIRPDTTEYDSAMEQQPEVFETMHDALICEANKGEIEFYTWGDEDCCLPAGSTRATLKDDPARRLMLRPGDVLIFEEARSPDTGLASEKNPNYRHAVRLTRVYPEAELIVNGGAKPQLRLKKDPLGQEQNKTDPLTGQLVVDIEWAPQDALPFSLSLREIIDPGEAAKGKRPVSIARGNIVLAEHGKTLAAGKNSLSDNDMELMVPPRGRYWPSLKKKEITHSVLYDDAQARQQPAVKALVQDPREALAKVTLQDKNDPEDEPWSSRRDLLDSDEFAHDFVVEIEDDRTARIRFGDGTLGEKPRAGSTLKTVFQVGNGRTGNVGAGTIAHIINTEDGIESVTNPLPARGGIDPESVEEVRLYAPQAFRTQQRAVTAADYAAVAGKHPEVQKAMATLRWTGSWHTMFLTIDRKGGREIDDAFKSDLISFINQYRLAGHDLEIEPPIFVPLDIIMTVCVEPDYFRDKVKQALLETFGSVDLPGGKRGFFHPDNFTFGQPVYLSQVIAVAMQVPGVKWVDLRGDDDRFQRWGKLPNREIEEGLIKMDRLEIARLDNNPSAPENGKIDFLMEGGL